MNRHKVTYVEYHSKQWDALVEQGWVTESVSYTGGIKLARMVKS